MEDEEEFTFHSTDLPAKSYDFFKTLRNDPKSCGIIFLSVGNRSISAHRLIIAAAIPYFHDIFTSSVSDNDEKVVDFSDIDPAALESLLDFAYTCKIVITMENVKNVLYGACRLHLEEVREACCNFLVSRLRPENVLSIRNLVTDQLEKIFFWENLADALKTEQLLKLSYRNLLENTDIYIMENFTDVSKTQEFLNLPFSYFQQILKSDELRVSNEEEVFKSIIRWVQKDLEQRKGNLPELLKEVRMPFLSLPYLKNVVAKEDLIRTSCECRELVDEGRAFHSSEEEKSECNFSTIPRRYTTEEGGGSMRTVPRRYTEISRENAALNEESIYAIYSNHVLTVKCLNNSEMTLKKEASTFVWYYGASTAVAFDELYCFTQDSVFSYNPRNDTFNPCRTMPSPRNFAGAANLYGKIYVCGGTEDFSASLSASDVVECYDPKAKKWEKINSMRECRQEPGAATLGKYTYVSGGITKSTVHRSVEKYDTRSGKWRFVSPMLSERYGHGFTALNDRLYACGGKNSKFKCIASAEVYNPVKKKWSPIAPMKSARFRFKLLPHCGKLYAVGGFDDQSQKLGVMEIYDPATNTWNSGEEIDSEYFLSAEVVPSSSKKKASTA